MTTAPACLDDRLAALAAELALAGFALNRTTDDQGTPLFIVSQWALTKRLSSIDAVTAFVSQVAPADCQGRR